MTRKNPVGKLAETALSTVKDPLGAAHKVVDQAKGTAALGRVVAEQAGSVVGKVASRAAGKGRPATPPPGSSAPGSESGEGPGLRSVPAVNEPAHTQAPGTSQPSAPGTTKSTTGRVPASKKSGARKSADSPKKHGDALLSTPAKATREAKPATENAGGGAAAKPSTASPVPGESAQPVKKSTKKAPAKKSPATETAKKAPAKKSPAKKSPEAPTKPVTATPADVAEVVEAAVAEDPKKTAAQPAQKFPAKKAPAKKSSPGGKLPPRKDAASAGSSPDVEPGSSGDSHSEHVVDPAEANQVASEAETLRKAAQKDPS